MNTVQEHLRDCDRERLLDELFYDDILCDTITLLENKEIPLLEKEKRYKENMGKFIDKLLEMEANPADGHILYLYDVLNDSFSREHELDLIRLDELKENIDCNAYAFDFSNWNEAIGYLVADTKLNQDNMVELLALFIREITFFGIAHRDERLEQVRKDLEQGIKEAKEGNTRSAEEVFEELGKKYGWPEPEKDEKQDELRNAARQAKYEYDRYGQRRERKRILESVKDKEAFEENKLRPTVP